MHFVITQKTYKLRICYYYIILLIGEKTLVLHDADYYDSIILLLLYVMNFSTPELDGSQLLWSSNIKYMDDYRPLSTLELKLVDVDQCDQHKSRNRWISMVPHCLCRAICQNYRKSVKPVQFPECLIVSIQPDGVVVLKTSSSSVARYKSSPEVSLD